MVRRLCLFMLALTLVAGCLMSGIGTIEAQAAVIGDDYPDSYGNVKKDGTIDGWRFYNRECVSFVAWRLNSANGIDFNNFMDGEHWGNAKNWGSTAKSLGYRVDMEPEVGAIAWWASDSPQGHVAWVAEVDGDQVTIEEYNYDNRGNYNVRTINADDVSGYIHIHDINIQWYLSDDGTLFIGGDGDMTDYSEEIAPWLEYAEETGTAIRNIVICDGVESISSWAFKGCEALESVDIAESVTEVAETAFAGCRSYNRDQE